MLIRWLSGSFWRDTSNCYWKTRSKLDRRFNLEGRGHVDLSTGEFPKEADRAVGKLACELGVGVPRDLEYCFIED